MTKSSYKKDEENQREDERKRSIMKERERQAEEMGPGLEKPDEGSDYERFQSGGQLAEWEVENKQSKIQG